MAGWHGLLKEVSFIPKTGKANRSSYAKRAATTLPFGKVVGSFFAFSKLSLAAVHSKIPVISNQVLKILTIGDYENEL